MSENAFEIHWASVSSALQPLLRDFIDGDLGFRWNLARTLRPLVDECAKGGLSPHMEVLRLFEIQFALRHSLSRFHEGLAHKKQVPHRFVHVKNVTLYCTAIVQ
jgi:hypothetical protein